MKHDHICYYRWFHHLPKVITEHVQHLSSLQPPKTTMEPRNWRFVHRCFARSKEGILRLHVIFQGAFCNGNVEGDSLHVFSLSIERHNCTPEFPSLSISLGLSNGWVVRGLSGAVSAPRSTCQLQPYCSSFSEITIADLRKSQLPQLALWVGFVFESMFSGGTYLYTCTLLWVLYLKIKTQMCLRPC